MRKQNKNHSDRFKHTHTYLGIFRHIQGCSKIILAYWGIFRILCNPNIFRTLVYSKSETEAYSEHRHIYDGAFCKKLLTAAVFFANYFCNISFSHSVLFLIKAYLLLQKYLFYIKKYSGPGIWGQWILLYLSYVIISFL